MNEVLNLTALAEAKLRRANLADALVRLFEQSGASLFHDQFKAAFAWVPTGDGSHEVLRVRSRPFKLWLTRLFWQAEQRTASSEPLQSALNTLEARARFDGPQHVLFNRVARHEGAIWYDLGRAAVRITPAGWQVVADPPILFYRYAHQQPQVTPVRGGDLTGALRYVNLPAAPEGLSSTALLFLVNLVTMLIPDIPHPLLCVDVLYAFRRCIGLNGINLVVSKADLLDRALLVSLERVPDAARRTEAEFWAAFGTDKGLLLGALFTVLSGAMGEVERIQPPDTRAWRTLLAGASRTTRGSRPRRPWGPAPSPKR